MSDNPNTQLLSFLAAKFDRVDKRFDAIDHQLGSMNSRLGRIEKAITSSRHEVLLFDEAVTLKQDQIDWPKDRIANIERHLGASWPPPATGD